MYKAASDAYSQKQNLALPPREIEAMAFSRAAHALDRVRETTNDHASRVSALTFNQMLWTLVQASVVDKSCDIPAELKANILSLSIFVDKQTFKAIVDPKAQDLDILIRIDKAMASGLFSNSGSLEKKSV